MIRTRWLFAVVIAAVMALVAIPTAALAQTDSDSGTEEPVVEGEAVKGTILDRNGDEPVGVEGAVIVVRLDGGEIGQATTDAAGEFVIAVPGAGIYEVEILVDTLPEGVALANPDRAILDTFEVRSGQQKSALFPLEGGQAETTGGIERFLNLFAKGLTIGSIIALAAVGLSVIFGLTGLINFAHGELVTFGAVMTWFFSASGAGPAWSIFLAGGITLLLAAGLGAGLELGLFRPLRKRRTGNVSLIVVTFGLAILLRHIYLVFIGGGPHPYAEYAVQRATDFGPISLPTKDVIIIVVSLIVMGLLALGLQRTRIGIAMRAVSDSKDLAESSGIDVNRVILAAWIIGTVLAALAGIFLGVTETVEFDMGFKLLLVIFAAVIVGGIGSAYGAIVGGYLIGIVMETSTYWLDTEFKLVTALGVLILTLLIRPQGIFGYKERVG